MTNTTNNPQATKQLTFTSIEALQQHLDNLNEADNPQITEALTKATSNLNEALLIEEAKTYLAEEVKDFYKAYFLTVCTSAEACRQGITTTQVRLTMTEGGKIEATTFAKPLAFKDFYKARLNLLASKHANATPTKEDRLEASKYFFGGEGFGLLQCYIVRASTSQALDKKDLSLTADMRATLKKVEAYYEATKKQNPLEGEASNNKSIEALSLLVSNFIGGIEGWQFTSYHAKALAQMIATTNKRGIFVVDNINNAMHSIAIITRHAKNNVRVEVKDNSKAFDNGKSKKAKNK